MTTPTIALTDKSLDRWIHQLEHARKIMGRFPGKKIRDLTPDEREDYQLASDLFRRSHCEVSRLLERHAYDGLAIRQHAKGWEIWVRVASDSVGRFAPSEITGHYYRDILRLARSAGHDVSRIVGLKAQLLSQQKPAKTRKKVTI